MDHVIRVSFVMAMLMIMICILVHGNSNNYYVLLCLYILERMWLIWQCCYKLLDSLLSISMNYDLLLGG